MGTLDAKWQRSPRARTLSHVLLILARVALGAFFVYAACSKLYFQGGWHLGDYHFFFAMAIDSYKMLPMWTVEWMAWILPWFELTLGALLISGVGLRWIGSTTIGLLLVFLCALIHAKLLHLEIICGCTGDNEKVETAILRDGVLLALALSATIEAFIIEKRRSRLSS